jgi:serine/threonine protein kinase
MPAVEGFLKTVLRSGLLNREQLGEALRPVPPDQRDNSEVLADHLVKTGRLSRFQARKLLQGKTLGLVLGPFQVLAPIGKGGMSTVYLARDSRSQLLVALKVLPPKKAKAEERLLARFLREMEMGQRVAHPHLAQAYEVGVFQGVYYIAMEFIPGRSLYRLVTSEGPLDVPLAARLFAEAALALDHAHCRGLIHRDLKPSNIMVTTHNHAKVLDLGLAIMEGEDGADHTVVGGQGIVVGTMDYIAPEQSEDAAKVDARSDVYGLGCTLYFALTGQPPFPGGTAHKKIKRHRSEEPKAVEELNPAVPEGFGALVRKMMAKRPEDRFESADQLRQELLHWAGTDPGLPVDTSTNNLNQTMVIEAAEAANPELMAEAIPVVLLENNSAGSDETFPVIPVTPSRRVSKRPAVKPLIHLPKLPNQHRLSGVSPYVMPLMIGGLIGLGVAGLILLLIQ